MFPFFYVLYLNQIKNALIFHQGAKSAVPPNLCLLCLQTPLKSSNVATVVGYTEKTFTHAAHELPLVNILIGSHRPPTL